MYCKTILRPLRWAKFPRIIYGWGLFIEGMMFPLMQIFVGLMQKYLINAVEYQDSHYMLYVYGMAVTVLVMVLLINPVGNYMKERSMRIYTKNLREQTVKKLLDYKYSVYETYTSGDLLTRMRTNLDSLPGIYTETIFRFLLGVFYGVGSIVIMLTFSIPLSMLVIILSIVETVTIARLSSVIAEKNDLLQELNAEQYQIVLDIIRSLRMIKMFSLTAWIHGRYEKASAESAEKALEIGEVNIRMNLLEDFFEAFNLILIFSVGVALYFWHKIDLGSVMSFLFLQDGISYMITNLREFFSGTSEQATHCERVQELMEQECEECVEHAEEEVPYDAEITAEGLSFRYPAADEDAIQNLSLKIPKGKLTVLYGPSGCGKSTLLKLLLGLYVPDEGTLRVGDMAYDQLSLAEIREHFAYVEQPLYLFYDTLEANIRAGNLSASEEDVMEAAKLARAHDFIVRKPDGYQTLVEEHGSNLSGGERQRIALARAILKDAPVLILDEATSAVDLQNEDEIFDCIRDMTARGKTVLMVSHREEAKVQADYVVNFGELSL